MSLFGKSDKSDVVQEEEEEGRYLEADDEEEDVFEGHEEPPASSSGSCNASLLSGSFSYRERIPLLDRPHRFGLGRCRTG